MCKQCIHVYNFGCHLTFFILLSRAGDIKYSHLADTDMQKVAEAAKNALNWLESARQALAHTPRHQQPPHTTHQIRQERQVIIFMISIVNWMRKLENWVFGAT